MKIGGFQKVSLIDYPDKIASTIFTIGCNFRCPFCHNPELVKGTAEEISSDDIFSYLKQKKHFLDAVVICGGEPTIFQDLPDFCKKLKELGFFIKIDTNGTNPEMLQELIDKKLIDYVAMDIKTSLTEQRYKEASGINAGIEKIKESVDIIKQLENYEFRTTCVPEIVTEQDLLNIASYLKEKKANKTFCLQQFQQAKTLNKKFEKVKPYSEQQLENFRKKLESFFKYIEIKS